MKDELISLKTAKLIPDPKKDEWWYQCKWFYIDTTHKDGFFMATRGDTDIDYPRPTQSLLQRWLREKHSIHIQIDIGHDKEDVWYNYYVMRIEKSHEFEPLCSSDDGLDTYESALEIGLQESLKLIR